MSRVSSTLNASERIWFDKYQAAEYMRQQGFDDITEHSVMYAHRVLKTLHEGKSGPGKKLRWHKNWLDEWAALQ